MRTRTTIAIDDDLIAEVQRGCGVKTKREAVEPALRQAARSKRREGLLARRGIG